MSRRALVLALLLTCPACSILSDAPPITPAYYDVGRRAAGDPRLPASDAPALRLRVDPGGEHLDVRFVMRSGVASCTFDETRRWTERPGEYVRRALERALFESGAWRRSSSGGDLTLDVEVVAFEEVGGATPSGRVALVLALSDGEGRGVFQRTIDVEQRLAGKDGAAAAAIALGAALDQAVAAVVGALAEPGVEAK